MQENLKVAIVQSDLHWENRDLNLARFESHLLSIKEKVDLIVLPEMFTTAFSMNAKDLAETMDGDSLLWMKKAAKWKEACLTGSLIIKEQSRYFNRMFFVHPDERVEFYDKRHLFRLAKENEVFTAGKEKTIVEIKNWRINLNVCYDLRFPVWARNTSDYDVLVNVANWPIQRIDAWDSLIKARAIENQSYVLACNRVGEDQKGNRYDGHSAVVDYAGKVKAQMIDDEGVLLQVLEKQALDDFRKKLPFYQDQDKFEIEV